MNSEHWAAISDFIEFLEMTPDDVRLGRRGWDAIEPQMPQVLDTFYTSRIMTGAHKAFPDFDVERLKGKQMRYWQALFAGDYGEVYRSHAIKIGHAHRQAGVSLTDYVLSYGWFLNKFAAIVRDAFADTQEGEAIISAMRKITFLDLSIASSTYYVTFID